MSIYNCHTHIFTHKNVPGDFLPLRLTSAMRWTPFRIFTSTVLKHLLPFTSNDKFDRYAKIAKMSFSGSQKEIFEKLVDYYPADTKFVILPMDFYNTGYDVKLIQSYSKQLQKLSELYKEYPEKIIPFIAVNPNRENILQIIKEYVEDKNFKGLKLYPKLGYDPNDFRLQDVYSYANQKKLPIITHCSQGGVKHEDSPEEDLNNLTQPCKYIPILQNYKNLKLCLGHFGGSDAWKEYRNNPVVRKADAKEGDNWLAQIITMLLSKKYDNLYADISYTVLDLEKNLKLLKSLLKNSIISSKILFGSDFYMSEEHKFKEKNLYLQCKKMLGEKYFKLIAEENPKRFLN